MMLGMPMPILGKPRKPPFSLSGTFASDLEGWAGSNVSRNTGGTRTSPGSLYINNASGGYAEYTVLAAICGGLTITASIWVNDNKEGSTRSLLYKIASGSWVTISTSGISSAVYENFSGSFNVGEDNITIRIESNVRTYWDDWVISGI